MNRLSLPGAFQFFPVLPKFQIWADLRPKFPEMSHDTELTGSRQPHTKCLIWADFTKLREGIIQSCG